MRTERGGRNQVAECHMCVNRSPKGLGRRTRRVAAWEQCSASDIIRGDRRGRFRDRRIWWDKRQKSTTERQWVDRNYWCRRRRPGQSISNKITAGVRRSTSVSFLLLHSLPSPPAPSSFLSTCDSATSYTVSACFACLSLCLGLLPIIS
jgi:hypothetical protein